MWNLCSWIGIRRGFMGTVDSESRWIPGCIPNLDKPTIRRTCHILAGLQWNSVLFRVNYDLLRRGCGVRIASNSRSRKCRCPLCGKGGADASYCQPIVFSPVDEGLTDSKTPDAGGAVIPKPQTRVWPKQSVTTRGSKTRRAVRPAGERLFLLAAFSIQHLRVTSFPLW